MVVKIPATNFMLKPNVLYKREMLSPVLIHVIIIFQIKKVLNKPDINLLKTVNQPHNFFSLLSTILLMVFRQLMNLDLICGPLL